MATSLLMTLSLQAMAQFNESGISAGFFDNSSENTINFSKFHLPPLAVLLENAKANPNILQYAKMQEIAQAEVAKQKRHIFSYIKGHASYGYGKTDMWGNNSSTMSNMVYQFQGQEQSYWNVGVNLSVPLEDILDLKASVKRKKLEVDNARLQKDIAYENLKLEITRLYITITNNLVALKTAGENAAIYQGAGQLNQVQFQQGDMSVEAFAETKTREEGAVSKFQTLQTQITSDIINLEILTRTPILTNITTDITLDEERNKESAKQIAKENKEVEKRIKREQKENEKKEKEMLKKNKEGNNK